jgi:YtkA-like protein
LRRPLFLLAAGSALALAGTALAGGWATVQLSSTPHGLTAGQAWVVDITVLQHGKTPLAGVKPTVTIYKAAAVRTTSATSGLAKGGPKERMTFAAKPTARTGVYRARVVFPSAGTWRYQVYDGFTQYGGAQTHRYAPVKIAARST